MWGEMGRRQLVLAMSALVVAGCQSGMFAPDSSLMARERQVVKLSVKPHTGSVSLRIRGLKAAFSTKTILSPLDMLDHLTVALTHLQTETTWSRTLDREQLDQELIETTFEAIPEGDVTLTVTGYNNDNIPMGEGSNEGSVTIGENTLIPVEVAIGFPEAGLPLQETSVEPI